MTNSKIIIAGGSGFIGEELIKYFGKKIRLLYLQEKFQIAPTTEILTAT